MSRISCLFICLLLASLSNCGFHPLYASRSNAPAVAGELNLIRINTIPDRQGQILRNTLIDLMHVSGDPAQPKYNLIVNYNEIKSDIGLNNDANSTRGQLDISVSYKLVGLADNAILTSGTMQITTGFNILGSEFATQLSDENAEERALRQAADETYTRVAIFFKNKAATSPEPNKTDHK